MEYVILARHGYGTGPVVTIVDLDLTAIIFPDFESAQAFTATHPLTQSLPHQIVALDELQ